MKILFKFGTKFANVIKFAKFAKFQKFQLDNLVDFEKCRKTRICSQRSTPIQPKTSEILPKICQKLAATLRVHHRVQLVHVAAEADGQGVLVRQLRNEDPDLSLGQIGDIGDRG